ncbi:MAG: DUF6090 family protein [Maribacter sp.]|nr:DUF6090 family protein [Maribacter sp.]
MINFFRKIRKKLADDNKTLKYLKYAIGEIVLVVIGILFALQINSWNQNRLERIEEIEILESMRTDFIQTKNRVHETIKLQSKVVVRCSKLMRLMIEKSNYKYNDSIADYLFSGALAYWRVEPVNGTYDALIGSGKTGIIQNQDLSRLLAEFSAELKYGFEDENYSIQLNSLLTEKCSAYAPFLLNDDRIVRTTGLKTGYSESDRHDAVTKHLNNTSFLGILYQKSLMEKFRLEYQQNMLKYVENILIDIESELEIKTK